MAWLAVLFLWFLHRAQVAVEAPLDSPSAIVLHPDNFKLQYQAFFFLGASFSILVDLSGVIGCKSTWLD